MRKRNKGARVLQYKECMRCVKTGDILAFTGPKVGSRTHFFAYLVRLFTMSEYSHVGIAYKMENRLYLLEAQVPEVRITPMGDRGNYYLIPMNVKVPQTVVDSLLREVGEEYSIMEALRSYFGLNNFKDKKWICTEYVKYYLDMMGVELKKVKTPSDVVKGLLNLHSKSLIYVPKQELEVIEVSEAK